MKNGDSSKGSVQRGERAKADPIKSGSAEKERKGRGFAQDWTGLEIIS